MPTDQPETIINDSVALMRTFSAIANSVTGVGNYRDKSTQVNVNVPRQLTRGELAALSQNGIIARAVHQYPDDAGQTWCKVNLGKSKKTPQVILDYWRYLRNGIGGLSLRDAFILASAMGRQDGEGYIILGIVDGKESWEPVDRKNIESIGWVRVLSAYEMRPYEWQKNPLNPEYFVTRDASTQTDVKWHRDRVLRFPGIRLLPEALTQNDGTNLSVIQAMFNSWSRREQSLQSGMLMIVNHQLRTLGMQGLNELLRNNKGGEDELIKRLLALDMGTSSSRTILYDLNEEALQNQNISYNGVDKIIEKVDDAWISDTDMPRIILLNTIGTTGLTSGEAFQMAMYDWAFRVQGWGDSRWKSHLERCVELTLLAKDSPIKAGSIDSWDIYIPLGLKLTPLQQMELEDKAADRSQKLVSMGAIKPTEVRKGYRGSDFNVGIILDNDDNIDGSSDNTQSLEEQLKGDSTAMPSASAAIAEGQWVRKRPTPTLEELLLGGNQGLDWLHSQQIRNDYVYVKKIINWNGVEIGLEYLPSDSRFGRKLLYGYGHFRRHVGEDGEALDVYVSPEFIADPEGLSDRPIFRIRQLADDGDFDEHKYIVGASDINQAEAAYVSAMPRKFMGGIEQVSRASLQQYHRSQVNIPKQDSVTLRNLLTAVNEDKIRQDFALGLLDRSAALLLLGYGKQANAMPSASAAIAARYDQELTLESSEDLRTDESLTTITATQDLANIRKIIEGLYTTGFTNKVSNLQAGVNSEQEIVGVFEDRVSPFLIKKIRFQISPDGAVTYQMLNPQDVEKLKEDSIDRLDAPKNCKKGIPCKGTCIAANKQCLGATTATQQTTVAAVVASVTAPSATGRATVTPVTPPTPPPAPPATPARRARQPKTTTAPPVPPATPPSFQRGASPRFQRTPSNPIKTNDTELDLKRGDLENRFGKKLVADAEDNVKRILDDPDTNVHIRVFSSSTLELIVGSKFKTSAELGIDTHTIPNLKGGYQDARNRVEEKTLGYNIKTTKPDERPIYGYMGGKDLNGGSHQDPASAYGTITVRLKPEVKDRSTFTGSDSFKSGIASDVVSAGNPPPPNAASLVSSTRHGYDKDKLPSHYPSFYADKSGDKGQLQDAASARNIDDLARSSLSPTGNKYIEAQVHGGVKPQDIAEIHFKPKGAGDAPTAAIAQFAKSNNVDLYVNAKKLSTQDLNNLITPPVAKDVRSQRFQDMQKALASDDFDKLADISDKIHADAQKIKLAPGENDKILKQLYKDSGFDALPEVKTEGDMDRLARSGKVMLTRGLDGSGANKFADDYRQGDYFTGNGVYGNGTYVGHSGGISTDGLTFNPTSNKRSQVRAWADVHKHGYITSTGATLRMALKDDAVVVTADAMRKDMNDIDKKISSWESAAIFKATSAASTTGTAAKADITAYKKSLSLKNAVVTNSTSGNYMGAQVTFHQVNFSHTKSSFGIPFQVVILDKTSTGKGYEFKTPDGTTVKSKARSLDKAISAVRDAYAVHYASQKSSAGVNLARIKDQADNMRALFGLPPGGDAGSGTSGRFAVMRGVDAIALNNSYEPKTFMNLLNRGKTIVQATNLDYNDGLKRGTAPR